MQILKILSIFVFLLNGHILAQKDSKSLFTNYQDYLETSIDSKRVKHSEIKPLIEKLKGDSLFNVSVAGHSMEGREIYLITIGKGDTHVLAWSQMHGDESTATMALFDIFNFFQADDSLNEIRKNILDNLTIHFIPMLNPDGAERFRRRNRLNIDLNRDALRLQFPESRILKSVRDSLNPKFGFNLHDQNTRYSAGKNPKSATISFLAPAFNQKKDINEVRSNTMKLIVNIYDELNKYVPGHIGRYDDEFEPRAFGDNLVKWGTSSVLIESGGWKDDIEKQFIRKLNFIALLSGFQSIANKNYVDEKIEDYQNIPENEERIFDVLLKNLTMKFKDNSYKVDVGINRIEKNSEDYEDFYIDGEIDDIGDLSTFYGYEEIDMEGYEIFEGKVYPEKFNSSDEIRNLKLDEMVSNGYIAVEVDSVNGPKKYTNLPMNLILTSEKPDFDIAPENKANFILKRNNNIEYIILNGFLIKSGADLSEIKNGIIFR